MDPLPIDIQKLVETQSSIICVDTCIILDIFRDPTRQTVRAHEARAVLSLLEELSKKKSLASLIAEQVIFEFNENFSAVKDEADRALIKFKEQSIRIGEIAAIYGPPNNLCFDHLTDHVTRTRSIANQWIANSTFVKQPPEAPTRALLRVNQAISPARKGKDSMKDCVVIETYLDIIKTLRNAGLKSRVIFVSSNTKDYEGENGSSLKLDLAKEFDPLNIEYAPNLAAAKHFISV